MQEIDFGRMAGELGICKQDGEVLAQRLRDFIKAQAGGWDYHEGRMDSELFSKENSRWTKYLGMTAPKDLPNVGLGRIFLVAWNYSGSSTSGWERIPMEIWLARGLDVEPGVTDRLVVDGYLVGKLIHGSTQIVTEGTNQFRSSIYINSPVIITPTISK